MGLTISHSAARVLNRSTVTIWASSHQSFASQPVPRVRSKSSTNSHTAHRECGWRAQRLAAVAVHAAADALAASARQIAGRLFVAWCRAFGGAAAEWRACVRSRAVAQKFFSARASGSCCRRLGISGPDVIQAWGHTAQVIIVNASRSRCDWKPRLVWSVAETMPLAKNAGMIDRQKLKYAAKVSSRADRIVYTSECRRLSTSTRRLPRRRSAMIPPGVDATRFKPDFEARRKLREQLSLAGRDVRRRHGGAVPARVRSLDLDQGHRRVDQDQSSHRNSARRARRAEGQCAVDGAHRRRRAGRLAFTCSANGRMSRRCTTLVTSCVRARSTISRA